jgi:hypothetical protein
MARSLVVIRKMFEEKNLSVSQCKLLIAYTTIFKMAAKFVLESVPRSDPIRPRIHSILGANDFWHESVIHEYIAFVNDVTDYNVTLPSDFNNMVSHIWFLFQNP